MESSGPINPLTSLFLMFDMSDKPCASTASQPPRDSPLQSDQFLNTDMQLHSPTPDSLPHNAQPDGVLQVPTLCEASNNGAHHMITRSKTVGAAVAIVGLAAYRVYAARKNTSSS
ncbi:hypothetical protein LWI29_031721 [Acer saccharum]|uniref:Uncharacterized protein n=1 Tax=Acer saccharum TaxID=4024 RepID=A0AA39T509_ACESA|nr:hypothetical protein LWI29_031721 [Acer saccharum]